MWLWLQARLVARANWRDNVELVEIAAWGALLRERKVTTAALKALRCSASGGGADFVIIIDLTEQQLGRCPKHHKGLCPLTLQGTLSLDPFARLS